MSYFIGLYGNIEVDFNIQKLNKILDDAVKRKSELQDRDADDFIYIITEIPQDYNEYIYKYAQKRGWKVLAYIKDETLNKYYDEEIESKHSNFTILLIKNSDIIIKFDKYINDMVSKIAKEKMIPVLNMNSYE